MKILYVANERNPAQLAATALRTLAEDVRLEWARDLSGALSWVYYNRDVAVLVVEDELRDQSCAAFVDHVRGLGLAAPVIVVCPHDVGTPLLALKAGADDYVANNHSLLTNLPGVVAGALQRAQAAAHLTGQQPVRLLYVGDAALARRCLENSGWSIEISEPERTSNGTFQPIPPASAAGGNFPFDVLLVEHDHPGVDAFAILNAIASRSLNVRVILVVAWDEKLAIPAMKLGASDCVVKATDAFRALFFKLDRTRADIPLVQERSDLAAEETAHRESLERQLRDARAAARDTQRSFDSAAAHFRERESRLQAAIEEDRDSRKALEEQLAAAEAALAESEQRCALVAAESADHLAKRSGEYRATLAQSLRARDALKQQLSDRTAALDAAKRALASEAANAAERWARREEELRTQVSGAVAVREGLEQRLAELDAALEQAEQRCSREAAASAERLAERGAEFTASLGQATRARDALEQRLAESEAARQAAEERASESSVASAQLARREAELNAALAQAVTARQAVEQELVATEAALEEARQAAAADASAGAERFRLREVELGATISKITTARHALETQLAETEAEREALRAQEAATRRNLGQALAEVDAAGAARAEAEQRHGSELAAAATHLSERQVEHDAALTLAVRARDALDQQLRDAAQALDVARQQRASESAVAADQLARREAELNAALGQAVTARQAVEQELVDAEAARTESERLRDALTQQLSQASAALDEARQAAAAEANAGAERFRLREAELGAAISDVTTARHALETQLTETETALQCARQALAEADAARHETAERHASEVATVRAQLAERQARSDRALSEAAAAGDALRQQVRDVTAALDRALQEQAVEAAAAANQLARREAELGATIAETVSARDALVEKLAAADIALSAANERAAAERSAAVQQAAQLQTEFEARLADADQAGAAFEQQVRDVTAALENTRQRHLAEAAAASDHLARREAELSAAIQEGIGARNVLEQELAAAATRFAERQAHHDAQLAQAGATREALERQLRDVTAALHASRQQRETEAALAAGLLERREEALGGALAEATAARYALALQLVDAKSAFDDLEAHKSELAAAATRLAERQAEHDAMAAHAAAVQSELEGKLEVTQEQLQRLTDAHNEARQSHDEALERVSAAHAAERARLDGELSALLQELDVTRRDRDTLRTQADRLPQVLTERDESQADNRRLFEHSPVGQFRCNRDGTLTQINRAFVGLLGYRTGDDLRKVDFAKTIFESADDLHWLIERCLNTGTAEAVETTWRRESGRRLVVKLVGVAASPDSIEIVVEDMTEIRELEERLRRSHPMEAVGRLASEVAATCDNLLRDVSQDGQQWLAAIHDDTGLRHQGEMLLGEVTRAASFLRQLSVYGNEQAMALGPVNLQRVLRDLAPVLKRVAGDDIELVLPKASPVLNVDMEPERVERVFVNVASYARERMPHGGRLHIELATVVVDRRFLAKYPNVRPGDHVLITITEVRGMVHTGLPAEPPDDSAAAASRSAPEKPGVDLGALLGLVGDCGGHVWMSAEPPGNMVLKIHLPRPASDGQQDRRAPVPRLDQRRTKARWFRH